jgi:XTP/dITP diphosphohydrolase
VTKVILSTRNAHKVQEIQSLLPSNLQLLSLQSFPNAPQVVEDAATFAGNATKKAVQLAEWLSSQAALPCMGSGQSEETYYVLADDSGLEVDALHGAPGVHSARFAAIDLGLSGNSPDMANNGKLLRLLQDVPWEKRTARFRCVIALVPVLPIASENRSPVCNLNETEVMVELFDGACEGRIGFAASGQGGFGYDPLFIPDSFKETFAELGEEAKNQISHRAKALSQLRQRWLGAWS